MKQKEKRITIGLDLGEKRHRFCVLDGAGEVVEEGGLNNDRESLAQLGGRYARGWVVMEAGAQSPWISRYVEGLGLEVVVSNPRKVRAIYQDQRKSDSARRADVSADRADGPSFVVSGAPRERRGAAGSVTG